MRIADIIISPDTIIELINGGLSVPLDYGYLIFGIFDTDTRYQRETERIRMVTAIKYGILNYDNTVHAVEMILQLFNKYLSESKQDKIYRGVIASISGRLATNYIASKIAMPVIEKTSFTYTVFKGKGNPVSYLSTMLLFGGMVKRSIRTSDNLNNEAPEIYNLLRPRNYDLIYFLFIDTVQPFVDAIHVRYTEGQPVFNRLMKRVEERINSKASAKAE